MLNKLKDILNTYTDEELKELDLWINSSYEVKQIIVDDYNIDLITDNADVRINGSISKDAYNEEGIKDIVTKEQFASVKHEVE